MFEVKLRRPPRSRLDPAPSRWAWRMQRLMLTPGFRFGLRVGLPFALTLIAGTIYLSDEERRTAIGEKVAEVRRSIEERPEFMVKLMAIDGASKELSAQIRETVPLDFPLSSFDLDLAEVRSRISDLPGIQQASVRIRPGGLLQVDVVPRVPVALWRSETALTLVDATGAAVRAAPARGDRADLPLIAGEGATDHVTEALDLVRAAAPLGSRLRGLVRMGERRWDVVLDRDQRILLPETGAVQALERVIALEGAQDVLSRDVVQVDMRIAARPTIRMNKNATEEWWHVKQYSGQ